MLMAEMTSHGLAHLLKLYCKFIADKKYQLADWRIRPLPKEMLMYAQADTHFLLFIYDNLRNALLDKSRPSSPSPDGADSPPSLETNPQRSMRQVLDRSAETALQVYERHVYDSVEGTGSLGYKNFFKKFRPDNDLLAEKYKKLHKWRDDVARKEDVSIP